MFPFSFFDIVSALKFSSVLQKEKKNANSVINIIKLLEIERNNFNILKLHQNS